MASQREADIIPIISALPHYVRCRECEEWCASWDNVHPVEHCTIDAHGYVILCNGSYK